jgi:hypothetical protein
MKLDFTIPELQTIVNALEQRPYGEVAQLLINIKTQFDAQQQAAPKPAPQRRPRLVPPNGADTTEEPSLTP